MISPADLAGMRSTLVASLPDTAEVHRRTAVSDGAGGTTDTWAPVGSYACRVAPAVRSDRLAEIVTGDALRAVTSWILTLPALADVTERDRIFVGARQFEVSSVFGPRSVELGRRVMCQEIQ